MKNWACAAPSCARRPAMRPLSVLFQDLDQILTRAAQPVARALGRYVQISSGPLISLEHEILRFMQEPSH